MKQIVNTTPILFRSAPKLSKTLFETIQIRNNTPLHLPYHQQRVDGAFKEYYKTDSKLQLDQIIHSLLKKQNLDSNKTYRLKIIYNKFGLTQSSIYIYSKKTINSLLLIEMPNMHYRYKYTNRELFKELSKKYSADEFLITQNGYLTDTTIANIALFHIQQQQWHTPVTTLLEGTTRQRLIKQQKITPQHIHYQDLKNYSKIALFNAMVGFDILN